VQRSVVIAAFEQEHRSISAVFRPGRRELLTLPQFKASNPGERKICGFCRYLLTLRCREIPKSQLGRSALVFSPHPDDESLGCGGTIIKKRQAGATVKLVHMTDGSASHSHLMPARELAARRKAEAVSAAHTLDVEQIYFLDFADGALGENVEPAAERVLEILRHEEPEELFVPHHREPIRQARDHIATTDIVMAALASYRNRVTIWEYPIWFWFHWPWVGLQPDCPPLKTRHVLRNTVESLIGSRALIELSYSVDITDVIPQKASAIAEHKSQMTRLIEQPSWTTLADISHGQFLESFYYPREFFRRSVVG
jgi:LmbE family N-acetylglucosaminyl deacetylase